MWFFFFFLSLCRHEHAGFIANAVCPEGIVLVGVEYSLAPKASLTTIVDECRKSLAWAYEFFPCAKLFAIGHSAGGHLVGNVDDD